MKLRVTLLTALLAVGAFAADVTGKWAAEMPGRGGQPPRTQHMEFKIDGGTLTGSFEGPRGSTPISEGKVDGDTITFKVVREMNGNSMTQKYVGTISGDVINFKVSTEGREGPAREFTAKRAN